MSDLIYIDQGLFTAFIPETKEGEKAFNELANITDGTGKVLTIQAKNIIARLRKAGYSVSKVKKSSKRLDEMLDDDQLMKDLGL